ncbi:MAG: N-succinylarginine dihydrolase [bacterium]
MNGEVKAEAARAEEVHLQGLPGPTHTHAGLAFGNLASMLHRGRISSPREAALQILENVRLLRSLGLEQAVLPPHERPDLEALRRLGFSGSDERVLGAAGRDAPHLLAACFSSSSMWAANAATVSPGSDTSDGRVHITPANLVGQFHRALEAGFTARVLRLIFADPARFVVHDPLPASLELADEGAANQMRLSAEHGGRGVEVFVYGSSALRPGRLPRRFPARQTLEASRAVGRLHGLEGRCALFVRQNADAIDAGAFHNDVVAVADRDLILHHELAFDDNGRAMEDMAGALADCCGRELVSVKVGAGELSLEEAVRSYLFNSQLVTLPDGSRCLVAPSECRATPRALACIERLVSDPNPISSVRFVDLGESMRNGGGPACLRLRVVLTAEELDGCLPGVRVTDALCRRLARWVETHYRESLGIEDLLDPSLIEESRRALDELSGILGLGSIYRFQREAG